jgi:DNA replication protein DnaC
MESIKGVAQRLRERLAARGIVIDPETVYQPLPIADSPCKPDCPVCGGLGFITSGAPLGDPEFGKMRLCPKINPLEHPTLRRFLGLAEPELDWNWDRVLNVNNAREAVRIVRETIERGYGWVYLWGGTGLAKSLILKVAVAEYARRHSPLKASYADLVSIMDHIRSGFDATNPNEQALRILDHYREIPLLAIDELDKINKTQWVSEREFVLLNHRYQQAIYKQQISLFASNLGPNALPDYLYSRIMDGRFEVVQLQGADLRPGMTYALE